MKRSLPAFLLLVTCIAATAASPDESPDESILWSSGQPERAIFVPQSVLARTPIADLPLSEHERGALERRLAASRDRSVRVETKVRPIDEVVDEMTADTIAKVGAVSEEQREGIRRMVERSVQRTREIEARYRPGCEFRGTAAEGPPMGPVDRLADRAKRSALVFSGTVTAVVPGWSTVEVREVTMVYLEVEEVFRDREGFLWPGKLVAFAQVYGDLELDGAILCTVPETLDDHAAIGDRILVLGSQSAVDSTFVEDAETHPVVDGRIVPQPDIEGRSVEPAELATLRDLVTVPGGETAAPGGAGR